jgi:hypothetical protein
VVLVAFTVTDCKYLFTEEGVITCTDVLGVTTGFSGSLLKAKNENTGQILLLEFMQNATNELLQNPLKFRGEIILSP